VIIGDARSLAHGSPDWRDLTDHCRDLKVLQDQLPLITVGARTGEKLVIERRGQKAQVAVFEDEDRESTPEIEPGFECVTVQSPITDEPARIIWPDSQEDMAFARQWVARLVSNLDSGKFATIAFDSEWIQLEPLCLQIGEIFPETYDPFTQEADCPPIKTSDNVVVFCTRKTGTPMWTEVSALLTPLFSHPKITIATFDFTNDILLLDTIGIKSNLSRLIDAQLLHCPTAEHLLVSKLVKSLGDMIGRMDFDDPALQRAQPMVQEEKRFPWNANALILEVEKRPVTDTVSKRFLEYAASDVPLTGLAMANVLHQKKLDKVALRTQVKLREYQDAIRLHNRMGPWLVRQAEFKRVSVRAILAPGIRQTDTFQILDRWRDLKDVLWIHQHDSNGEMFPVHETEETIVKLIQEHLTELKSPHHWPMVKLDALIVTAPGATRVPFLFD
jgi:hypothetical protein